MESIQQLAVCELVIPDHCFFRMRNQPDISGDLFGTGGWMTRSPNPCAFFAEWNVRSGEGWLFKGVNVYRRCGLHAEASGKTVRRRRDPLICISMPESEQYMVGFVTMRDAGDLGVTADRPKKRDLTPFLGA